MKIGNVITKDDIQIDELLNKYSNLEDIENDLPTIFIGWDNMNKLYPNQSIMENNIDDNLFWCVSKFEDRSKHVKEIEKFIQYCFDYKMNKYKFYYVDLINIKLSKIKKVISKVKSSTNVISYQSETDIILFINDFILSFNINVLEFLNVDIEKLTDKIINISSVILPNKDSETMWLKYRERVYEDKTYMGVLYSLREK